MKLFKPKFWNNKYSVLALFLVPFSYIVILFIFLKKKVVKERKFEIPIICIGNIYIGGTGKTPLAIFLNNELKKLNKNPIIIRKFYKNQIDEYELIKQNCNELILNTKRTNGIKDAVNKGYATAILDDGFQDCKLRKNLSIICFHHNQLLGNGYVLPAGPLRENLKSLKNADIIIINGQREIKFEEKLLKFNKKLKFFYTSYEPTNLEKFKNKKLMAIAGIGNPENFFNLLVKYDLNIEKKLIYPDHYRFSKNEILDIVEEAKKNNLKIITTEKDFYKFSRFNIERIEYLKVSLVMNEKQKFLKEVSKLYDKTN
tara:strand:- start:3785 stop:4726 length:942 start_codon:yes stop_codon:yes gene_type:complete